MGKIELITEKYHLMKFTILQLGFWIIRKPLISLYCHFYPRTGEMFQFTKDSLTSCFTILFEFIWIVTLLITVMHIHYSEETSGRNYFMDRIRYGRSYYDLIKYFRESDKSRLDTSNLEYENWKNCNGIPLGHIEGRLIKRDTEDFGNIMLYGLPGFNKTTGAIATAALRFGAVVPDSYMNAPYNTFSDSYINELLLPPKTIGSTIVVDIKGDILHWAKGKRRIKVFDPENSKSCHFNPLFGIQEMSLSERRVFIEGMSEIIVQEEEGGKYFTDGGRDFFSGVALFLLDKDINISFMEIVDSILHNNGFDWIKRIIDSSCDEAKDFLSSYFGSNEKNVAGCYNAIAKAIRKFKTGALPYLLNGNGDVISIETLEEGWDIYIEIPQDKISQYSATTTILIQQLMNGCMKRPDSSFGVHNRPLLFILDEMPKLRFDFDTLENCLSTMRSKNVSCLMASQSIGQYKKRYGEEGFVNLVDCCQYICCLSALEPSSRKWFSDLLGTRKVLKRTTSAGGVIFSDFHDNVSVQEARELIMQPEEFSQLDDKTVIYIVGEGYIVADKCKVYE